MRCVVVGFHRVLTKISTFWLFLRKKKSIIYCKTNVLARNLFFFFCVWPVSRETGWNWWFFFCFFSSKMKLAVVSWVKLAKIVKPSRVGREKNETDGRGVEKKNETDGRGAAAAVSFIFFPDTAAVSFIFFSRPTSGRFHNVMPVFTHETISQFHFLSQ